MAEPGAGLDIRRVLLLSAVGVVLLFALMFFLFRGCGAARGGRGDYTTIYSNLELKDAANAIARLKELAIPYEVKEQGRSIAVPKARSDEARLGLAEKNLPAGGAVGWEIFDETRLGATDFDRRIQLIRAISGELSRTIRHIEAIEDVRVQIVIPETRLFAVTVAPVTASVLLRTRSGFEISQAKINGIVHLVSSSVENLQPENVTVIDDSGRILSAQRAAVGTEVTTEIAEEATVETTAPLTVEAVAAATPEMSAEEKMMIKVQANKNRERDLAGKAQEILNRFYPLNTVLTKVNIDLESGLITAVVLIDNRVEVTPDLRQATYKSVAAAVGYDRDRGDKVILQLVPFHLAAPEPKEIKEKVEEALATREAVPLKAPAQRTRLRYVAGGAAGLVILVLAFGLFRLSNRSSAIEPPMPARSPEKLSALDSLRSTAQANPERIAELLKKWLSE